MAERDTKRTAPDPGQAVAAATTKTNESQAHARNIRSTDWLAPGEATGTEGRAKAPPPAPERSARADECLAPYEHMLSEARAIQEALVRLGPGASAAEVQRDLERFGVRVRLEDVERIKACTFAPPAIPAPTDPAELVRTEGERVPPPRGGPTA